VDKSNDILLFQFTKGYFTVSLASLNPDVLELVNVIPVPDEFQEF